MTRQPTSEAQIRVWQREVGHPAGHLFQTLRCTATIPTVEGQELFPQPGDVFG
jgi:hypothetical protein